MNILIVDDEPRHRRGMMNLILSFRPNDTLTAAADGEAALESIRQHRPDLVLTDIRMPNMDGLQFLQQIQNEQPKPRVVMVSAYNRFDYAQEALRYGASDYLLKPIDADKLRTMLARIDDELSSEARQSREAEELRQRLYRSQFVYRSRLFSAWLNGSLTEEETQEFDAILELNGSGIPIFTEIAIKDRKKREFAAERFVRELELKWSNCGSAVSFVLDVRNNDFLQAITILRRGSDLSFQERQTMIAAAKQMQSEWEAYGRIFQGFGPLCFSLREKGGEACRSAVEAGKHGIRESLDGPVFHDELQAPNLRSANPFSDEGGEADALAEDCLRWIEEHLHEDLTLERAAERFFFNPSYFSTWIKQQTGRTFTQQLTEARMHRARLLLGKGRRIRETSEACGYPDTKYFCRVFKKAHGVSPAAYKHGSMLNKATQ